MTKGNSDRIFVMSNRVKQAFKKAYRDDLDYSYLLHPHISSRFSTLAIFITVLGWAAFFAYVFELVSVSDLATFLNTSMSTEGNGIRYRALLFLTPVIFTVIGYLANRSYNSSRKALA